MARGRASHRYAKALFELAREEGRVAEVRGELAALGEQLATHRELRDVLLTPLHPVAQRRSVLNALADRLGSSPVLRNFYAFLIDQRRLVDFGGIRAGFDELADREAGVTRAEVRSASPLRDDQLQRVRAALKARTGQDVEVDVKIDPELLGGVVAKVGDLVFDGSLRTQLTQLRANLTGN